MLKRFWTWVAKRALKFSGVSPRVGGYWLGPSSSGVEVDEHTALNYSVVWAAVSTIAQSIGSLPALVYYTQGKDRVEAENHPLTPLLRWEPNTEMTSMTFMEALQAHALVWGNAFAEIELDNGGRPLALWPIPPHIVKVLRDPSGQLFYQVKAGDETVNLAAQQVLHVPGLGYDGTKGYGVVRMARESLGLGMGAEKYGATLFGNGAMPGGILTHPAELTDRAREKLRADWEAVHAGPGRAHRLAILEEGMQWQQLTIPPDDAQFLGTREFQVAEVARWFGIPPHLLRDLSKATFSNIEQQSVEYVMHTIRPWLIRWEQEIRRKLFSPAEKAQGYYVEFNIDSLLRATMSERYAAYNTGRNGGWLSVNDIRAAENMNRVDLPGADDYLIPANMNPMGEDDTTPNDPLAEST